MVSVAETFIHGELTPREEATLRQTLRPSASSSSLEDESENLPGGFNPFGYNLHAEEARKELHGDDDPAGVSVFATLIERLLAKFEFSAVDTKITIVYPGRASFTLSVSEIAYHTDSGPLLEVNNGCQSVLEGNNHCGQIRTVSISGLKVTSRDLRILVPSPTVTSTLSPVSFTASRRSPPLRYNPSVGQLSRGSSSSSLDEDTQLMMSQSIAMLPPRSPPLSSASGSMYQSAVSTEHTQSTKVDIASGSLSAPAADNVVQARPRPQVSIPCHDSAEDVILSFGLQPIVFSLQTPSRLTPPSGQVLQAGSGRPASTEDLVSEKSQQETLHLSVTVGILACAFRSRHLCVLLDIVDACISKLPTPSPVSRKETASEPPRSVLCLEANVVIRAIAIIALPVPVTGEPFSLDSFYERPLVPPRLPCTYLRLFLDALSVSFWLSTPSPDQSMSGAPRTPSSTPVDESTSAKLVILDVSLFAFHGLSSADDPHVAAPILLTDHYLPTLHVAQQYRPSLASERPQDIKLPMFEVVDWTQAKLKSGSAKLSTWRLRNHAISGKSHVPSPRPSDLPSSPNPFIPSPLPEAEDGLPVPPAIEASGRLASPLPPKQNSRIVDVKVAPLHLFLDLGMIFRDNLLMHFVDDIASAALFTPRKTANIVESQLLCHPSVKQMGKDGVEMDNIEIQQTSHERQRDETRRLEALVLEDLNLDTNYQCTGISKSRPSRQRSASPKWRVGTLLYLLFSVLKTF